MKLKDGYLLRNVAGVSIVVPVAERVIEFKGMMTLNETGAFLWEQLQEEKTKEQLLAVLLEEFEVEEQMAEQDLQEFLLKLNDVNVLDE